MLSKRGAVIDIDLIVGYLIFISVIVLIINYSVRLTAPFKTNIQSLNTEADTLAVSEMINNKFNINSFSSACNISYASMRRFKVSYVINGFETPFVDENVSHELLNGSVTILRDSNDLIIESGSNGRPRIISVKLMIPSSVSVTNISLEQGDDFSVNYDSYGGTIIDFNANVSYGDKDKIIISNVNGIIGLKLYNVNLSNCFIGSIPVSDYCGVKGLTKHSSFSRFALINDNLTNYYATIRGDIWWTS